MGRATISGGGEDGLYNATIVYDDSVAQVSIAAIDKEIAEIDEYLVLCAEKIAEIDSAIDEKSAEFNDLAEAYNDAVRAAMNKGTGEDVTHPDGYRRRSVDNPFQFSGDVSFSYDVTFSGDMTIDLTGNRAYEYLAASLATEIEPIDEDLKQAFQDLVVASIEVHALINQKVSIEKYRDMLLFRQKSIEKRKAQIEAAIEGGDPQEMWCADLTEDLSGEVDTLEVIGAPNTILIQPEGTSNLTHNGTAGKLSKVMAMSPAQCGLAWALLPGWQKWRPTYRVGTIHSIDYGADTGSVTLDEAVSVAQGLDINQAGELESIPVEYMTCDANAFEDGDRVVVEFPGQLWEQGPKVIGFEDHPQPCGGYAGLVGSTDGFASLEDDNIFEWRQGDGTDTPGSSASTSLRSPFPEDGKLNNAWKEGAIIKVGAKWKYPWRFVKRKQFTMSIAFNIIIYNEYGGVIKTIPVQLGYGEGCFQAKDKCVGRWGTGTFTLNYLPTVTDVLWSRNYDYACDPEIYGKIVSSQTQDQYPYRVTGLNGAPTYNLNVARNSYYSVNSIYASNTGIISGTSEWLAPDCGCPKASCSAPGVDCTKREDTPIDDYLDVADPCDVVEDKGMLYIEQEWSMTGEITESGILLTDSTASLEIADKEIPFGPWTLKNATAGDILLTDFGPLNYKHHVGFSVSSINTAGSQAAAIAEQNRVGSDGPAGEWGPRQLYSRDEGYAHFYAVVDYSEYAGVY